MPSQSQRKHLILVPITLALFTSFSAIADNKANDIERISVVGDFREENIQDKSASISLMNQAIIERRSANHLEEIFTAAPNLNFASGSSRARHLQIRGIGIRSEYADPVQSSVGMIIDDIDFSDVGTGATLYDVSQVEVYRGPQGTRFGANALAGMVYLQSHEASHEQEGKITLGVGNYASSEIAAVYSNGVTNNLAIRVSAHQYQSDGFIKNLHLNKDDTHNRDELTLRGKVNWQISTSQALTLNLLHIDIDNGFDAFSLDNNRNTYADQPGFDQQESNAMSANWQLNSNDIFTTEVIFSFIDSDLNYAFDEDWAFGEYEWLNDDPIYQPDPCITPTGCLADFDGYSSFDSYDRKRKNLTAELRLISAEAGKLFNNTTDWVTGLYYKDASDDLTRVYTYDIDYHSSLDTEKFAAFFQLDSQLTEQWSTEFGLRIESHEDDFVNSADFSSDPDKTLVGGKLVLNYQVNENQLIYGSINRGYKVGGFNINPALSKENRTYDAEYLWNYELGYKQTFSEIDAWIRLAAFYMDRKDVQVKDYIVEQNDQNGQEFISVINNADIGFSQGIEIESGWQTTANLDVYANLGWLKAEFEDYTNAKGEVIEARELAHAPSYTFNLGANYNITEDLWFNIDIEGKDKFYFSDAHNEKSISYELIHLSINYAYDHWQFKLWARNLLDEDYYTRGFGGFGNDPRDGYTEKAYYQYGDPALFGLKAEFNF